MCVEVVSSVVDKIEQGEGGFILNGRYQAYLLDIACACKQLVEVGRGSVLVEVDMRVEVVCGPVGEINWWFHPKWPILYILT